MICDNCFGAMQAVSSYSLRGYSSIAYCCPTCGRQFRELLAVGNLVTRFTVHPGVGVPLVLCASGGASGETTHQDDAGRVPLGMDDTLIDRRTDALNASLGVRPADLL